MSNGWAQRLRINGKPFEIGLGAYPITTLAVARAKALDNARIVAEGGGPRKWATAIPRFTNAFESVISLNRAYWKAGGRVEDWRKSIETYALPLIGDKKVSEITTADVLAVGSPIWSTKRPAAAKVRRRVSAVMKWDIAEGHRTDDPAGDAITAVLPKGGHTNQHQQDLPSANVGAALAAARKSGAWLSTKRALELLTLTTTRSVEEREAVWAEIDLDSATWTIPAARMKAGKEHRIPLSRQAIAVLESPGASGVDSEWLNFPSMNGKVMESKLLSELLHSINVDCVPHGMSSSFRDWAAECSDAPREIAGHALGHVEGSASELAYRLTDYFEQRREFMQQWADYVLPGGALE